MRAKKSWERLDHGEVAWKRLPDSSKAAGAQITPIPDVGR